MSLLDALNIAVYETEEFQRNRDRHEQGSGDAHRNRPATAASAQAGLSGPELVQPPLETRSATAASPDPRGVAPDLGSAEQPSSMTAEKLPPLPAKDQGAASAMLGLSSMLAVDSGLFPKR